VVAAGAGAGLAAVVVFLAPPPVTPFLIVLMTVLLGAAAAVALDAAVFLTTVPVLFSLVSLFSLTLRAMRVPGLDVAGLAAVVAAARRVRVAAVVPAELALVLEVVVSFRVAPWRVARAFSTMLDSTLVAAAARPVADDLSGEPGRAICDFTGDAGRSLFNRELDEVGDRTCPGRMAEVSVA
jgi:hypothetical protein